MSDAPAPSRMVFHAPYALNRTASSASGIRPVRMRDAFEALGYEVWEVTGTAKERAASAKKLRAAIKDGIQFAFCYSESSTMPTSMTESHHLPLHPLLDHKLLADLREAGIKVGLFYRDIYWAFEGYGTALNPVKRNAALTAYRWDLLAYQRALDVLYLPSMLMAPHVKVGSLEKRALPPGHDMPEIVEGPATGVHLFYVGGLGAHYKLPVLFAAVHQLASEGVDVTLTACASADQWEAEKANYEPYMCDAIRVVHASGPALLPLYAAANASALFIEPNDYRAFASPVKLYEYVGQAKPVLASQGTLAGEFVETNGFGWTIPYTQEAAVETLRDLAEHPEKLRAQHEHLIERREEHSWLQRARTVAADLS